MDPELGRIVFGGLFLLIMLLWPQRLGRYLMDRIGGGEQLLETDHDSPSEGVSED
ncbi:hypothetical protein [Halobellus sp. EA9]|uniref:hypothetical protein n=1 Tax=Halobellus sp. EA9 TaxID=3421647 RepID=UPI003EC027E4